MDVPDNRNVIDVYKYWTEEAIRADLRTKHHNFSVLINNHFNDFNIGSVIRNANAFCAKEVIIHGKKKYDKRGTVGCHIYNDMKHVRTVEELSFENSILIGVDNVAGAVPIEDFEWPAEHVIMVFGQESFGLTVEVQRLCKTIVYIKQYGSVRSLNVGCSSAIVMYDYCRKMVHNPK